MGKNADKILTITQWNKTLINTRPSYGQATINSYRVKTFLFHKNSDANMGTQRARVSTIDTFFVTME